MLKRLFRRWFHLSSPANQPSAPGQKPAASPARPTALDQQAPLRQTQDADAPAGATLEKVIICREPVLNRQQKIAGYQFMLNDAAHGNIRLKSRQIMHLCAEVLVQNLLRANLGSLHKRFAFIDIPDSFLDHPCLTGLPPANTFFILCPVENAPPPSASYLSTHVRALRKLGYRIGIQDPTTNNAYFHLLPEADLVYMQPHTDIGQGMNLVRHILKLAPEAALLVRDLPGMEDFDFCYRIGVTLFQGGFVTSRENWQATHLGPNFARIATLLNKLRQDADTKEIASLLKQDAAITLRLLRYINSAANGLREHVSSIERSLALLGRAPLQRWLSLMLCASDRKQPRSAAVLETALVRARTMELLAAARPAAVREAMFLTGLLSLIDVILQQPIEHALDALAIDTDIRDGISGVNGPYAPALALAQACESMNAERVIAAAAACGVDPEQASTCYMEALAWTLTLQNENAD
ncbi:MAG: HDOD domain-containing protein [Azoarcus sp.]|jgi:EAL and modified HD-GYP domain-containing signal transduction protein|nr:HDOD domain-containing protein [Azoarcus sp.]